MPIASTDEQLALQASIREWAKRAGAIDAVRALEPGGAGHHEAVIMKPVVMRSPRRSATDRARSAGPAWPNSACFGIGMPATAGGADGSTADLAAALAQLTDSLVPGPVLPTLIAALVVRHCLDQPSAQAALRIADSGRDLCRRCAGARVGRRRLAQPDGSLDADWQAPARCSAAAARPTCWSALRRAASVWCLLPASQPGITLTERAPADFSRSLACIELAGVVAGPDQILSGISTTLVRDLAAVLFAVEAAAVAAWCARTAAEYAGVRYQFGRPIGSFQAIKHMCATMLCRAETAAALAWDAARAVDDAPAELPLIAAAAAAVNLDAAVDVAKDCIQVLGGIGFTWEHDAHLYLRRALALRQLLGGSAHWKDRTAQLGLSGMRRELRLDESEITGELETVREQAAQLAAKIAGLTGAEQRRALADSGYAAPAWPAPHGLAASPGALLVIDHELGKAGVSRPDLVIGGWAIPAILRHGTTAQADRFARPTLRGELTWCQLFSEPEAGSDLASLRTRAERCDGGWLLTGQKVWTSLAREADWAICLARTDAAAPKHKGLTYFLVGMDSPGIDIRPLREITGRQMFNQVFLDQVFVPDECVVGAPGDGWRVARTTLASERVAMGTGSSVGEAVEHLIEITAGNGAAGDPVVRQRLGGLIGNGMAVSLLDLRAVLAQLGGADAGPLAAVGKLVGVAHRQAVAETALELTGPAGAAADGDGSEFLHEFLLTRCLSIAGGTTQILLSLVAERQLGLPREEKR